MDKDQLRKWAGLDFLTEELKLEPKDEPKDKKEVRDLSALKHELPADEEKKKEGSAATAAQGGAKKSGQAREWLAKNSSASRGAFMKHAASFNMTPAYANAFFYAERKKAKAKTDESVSVFLIRHPNAPKFVLGENEVFNRYDWVHQDESDINPVFFTSEEEAEQFNDALHTTKNFYGVVEQVDLSEDDEQ